MLSRVLTGLQLSVLSVAVWLFVSPLAPPDPFNVGPQFAWPTVALLAAGFICVSDVLRGGWGRTRVDWIVAAFLALVAAAMLTTSAQGRWLSALLAVASGVGLFYAAAATARRLPHTPAVVLAVLIVGAAVLQLMAFAYHLEIGLSTRPKMYPSLPGWSGYPELGALAVLQFGALVGCLVAAFGDARPRWGTVAALACLAVVAAVEILYLYYRTAWVACAVIVLGSALIPVGRRRMQRAIVTGVLVAGVAVVASMASPTISYLGKTLVGLDVPAPAGGPSYGDVSGPSNRIVLWKDTWRMIEDSRYLGVGPGNFRTVFQGTYHVGLDTMHAHNLWLQQMAEAGVLSGIALAALWMLVLRDAWRAARHEGSLAAVGVLVALIGALAVNLVDSVPEQSAGFRVHLVTWVLLGLAAGAAPATALRHDAPSHG
jgi:O-antigen ligase